MTELVPYERPKRRSGHLLLVTPGFPADADDSVCTPPIQLLLHWLERLAPDLQVTVVSLHYPRQNTVYLWHGRTVRAVGALRRPLSFVAAARWVRRLDRVAPVDWIHALWLSDAAWWSGWIGRWLEKPVVVTVMGQDARPANRYLRWLPWRRLEVVASSDRCRETLRASGYEADMVIPWGVEPPATPVPAWSERPIDLLGVGSLSPLKQFEVLVRVAAGCRDGGRPVCVEILGDGPQRARLQSQIEELGLQRQVTLRGEVSRSEVLRRMGQSKVLVHPSSYEAYGMVLAEALAQGAEVISRPVGIAQPGPRLHIADGEAAMIAACLARLEEAQPPEVVLLGTAQQTALDYLSLYESLR